MITFLPHIVFFYVFFEEHQQSKRHKIATVYHGTVRKCKDIAEVLRENLNAERAKAKTYLLDAIRKYDMI